MFYFNVKIDIKVNPLTNFILFSTYVEKTVDLTLYALTNMISQVLTPC